MKFPFTKTNRLSIFEKFGNLNWSLFGRALDDWKDGQAGYLELKKIGKLKSPEQLGYYYGVILPEAFKAFKESGKFSVTISVNNETKILPLDIDTTDIVLKWRYGKWNGEYKGKGDMSMAECSAFEEWCIIWLAKYYNCFVPPADKNHKQIPK